MENAGPEWALVCTRERALCPLEKQGIARACVCVFSSGFFDARAVLGVAVNMRCVCRSARVDEVRGVARGVIWLSGREGGGDRGCVWGIGFSAIRQYFSYVPRVCNAGLSVDLECVVNDPVMLKGYEYTLLIMKVTEFSLKLTESGNKWRLKYHQGSRLNAENSPEILFHRSTSESKSIL